MNKRVCKEALPIMKRILTLALALVLLWALPARALAGTSAILPMDGNSMSPTLNDGDRFHVDSDLKIRRGSIVICHYPGRGATVFVKRAVAVPGDIVYRNQGVTHVIYWDGALIDEPLDEGFGAMYADYAPCILGEDEYFLVGDNRSNSRDSRVWSGPGVEADGRDNIGPIPRDMILGVADWKYDGDETVPLE